MGGPLQVGDRLLLDAGLAEITFDNQTRGRRRTTTVTVVGPNNARLQSGRHGAGAAASVGFYGGDTCRAVYRPGNRVRRARYRTDGRGRGFRGAKSPWSYSPPTGNPAATRAGGRRGASSGRRTASQIDPAQVVGIGGRFVRELPEGNVRAIAKARTSFGTRYPVVRRGLKEGSPAYCDRFHRWCGLAGADIPAFLRGAEYVAPANDTKI